MSYKAPTPKGAVGSFKAKPNLATRRQQMKYKVNTTSLTESGVVPIKGATKYPGEPTIYFTREAWVKQCHLVSKCTKEVGWFALVDYDEMYNTFTITELVIPNQEVTSAETDIGKENLADAAMELIEQGKDISKMFAWFHSHVNMGVSPSAQDEYQVEDFLEDLADQPEVPAFIRGIQNKQGDLKLDVYYIQHGIAYQNVDFFVDHDDDPKWLTDIEGEIKAKVKERVYTYNQQNNGFRGGRHQPTKSASVSTRYNQQYSYNGYENTYDDPFYFDDYDEFSEVDDEVDTGDVPVTPDPVEIGTAQYRGMDIVYSATTDNIDVLSDKNGQLFVCDEDGELYDYDSYTEVYGEIGGTAAIK